MQDYGLLQPKGFAMTEAVKRKVCEVMDCNTSVRNDAGISVSVCKMIDCFD